MASFSRSALASRSSRWAAGPGRRGLATYRDTLPNLATSSETRVIVQGFTGKASTYHSALSQQLGTCIVGGVSPSKGGTTHLDLPVFDTVRQAVRELRPEATSVFVPPKQCADAVLEAIEEEVPLIVAVAEGIPVKDQMKIMAALQSQSKSRFVGANSPGYCNPAGCRLGISPVTVCKPGTIGIVSRSGTLSYEATAQTTEVGLGQSYILGLGGDYYPGTRTDEALEFLLRDERTAGIILIGEVGGSMEEEAAALLSTLSLSSSPPPCKPIVGFIAGLAVPPGKNFGHQGALFYDGDGYGRPMEKRSLWERAGIRCVGTIGEVGVAIRAELDKAKAESSS